MSWKEIEHLGQTIKVWSGKPSEEALLALYGPNDARVLLPEANWPKGSYLIWREGDDSPHFATSFPGMYDEDGKLVMEPTIAADPVLVEAAEAVAEETPEPQPASEAAKQAAEDDKDKKKGTR